MDSARHVILRVLNPLFLSQLASYDVAVSARQVIIRMLTPRFLSQMVSYDVAFIVHLSLREGDNLREPRGDSLRQGCRPADPHAHRHLQRRGKPGRARGLHSLTSEFNLRTFRNTSLTLELNLSTLGTHQRVNLGQTGEKVSLS
jgi:hypothetical protein